MIRLPEYQDSFTFCCVKYEQDHFMKNDISNCCINKAFSNFQKILHEPCLTPSVKTELTVVNTQEAAEKVSIFEVNMLNIQQLFNDIKRNTVRKELGADANTESSMMQNVDWQSSFMVGTDDNVEALIRISKAIYTQLSELSNIAIDSSWMCNTTVKSLLEKRCQLTNSVKLRRTEFEQVMDVRTAYICISAIDSVLRRICMHEHEHSDALSLEYPAILNISCHDYWLEQLKANTHNNISLRPELYHDAHVTLQQCRAWRPDASCQIPSLKSLLLGCLNPSTLSLKIWESMHLQGLVSTHCQIAAPCSNFIYKTRGCIDFTKHALVQSLLTQKSQTTDTDKQISLNQQLGPMALLVKLVNTDIEHRVISAALGSHIFALLDKVTAANNEAVVKQKATDELRFIFDDKLNSLVSSACGTTSNPDISFLTEAVSGTDYNMIVVSSFCLQRALTLQGL